MFRLEKESFSKLRVQLFFVTILCIITFAIGFYVGGIMRDNSANEEQLTQMKKLVFDHEITK